MAHNPTLTVNGNGEDENWTWVLTCGCEFTENGEAVDSETAEADGWAHLVAHLGFDPRDTPTGSENPSKY